MTHIRLALSLVLLIGIFLINTRLTDADLIDEEVVAQNRLTATTLAASSRNTADFSKKQSLFVINGMKKGGYAVSSFFIKKDGKMSSNYRLYSEFKSGSQNFCSEIVLELYTFSFNPVYNGKVLNLLIDRQMPSAGREDWIVFVRIPDNISAPASTCEFSIIMRTWRSSPNEQGGFFDKKAVNNMITYSP